MTSDHSFSTHSCIRAPGAVCLSILWPGPLPPWYIVHVPAFPTDPWSLGILKAGLASRGWNEESIHCLSLVSGLCCWALQCLIQQWAHIFSSLPFVPCIVREALLAVFYTPGQIQSLLGFVFLNFIPGGSESVLVFLLLPDFVFDFG